MLSLTVQKISVWNITNFVDKMIRIGYSLGQRIRYSNKSALIASAQFFIESIKLNEVFDIDSHTDRPIKNENHAIGRNYFSSSSFHKEREDTNLQELSKLEGYYDSHAGMNTGNELLATGEEQFDGKYLKVESNRRQFHQIPVDPSILSYIESIGVGLRPMQKKKKKQKNSKKNKTRGYKDNLLDTQDEASYFANQNGNHGRRQRKAKNIEGGRNTDSSWFWSPPPPFGSSLANKPSADKHNDYIDNNLNITTLPVKIIGSTGSLKDEMPRSSKGLPEVALAGRSNVGKSTLLNALLYGNRFHLTKKNDGSNNVPEDRKFQRGKTPEGAKLPKGSKAIVSSKPGETKEITFYQLSSIIETGQAQTTKTENDKVLSNDFLSNESKQMDSVKNENDKMKNKAKMSMLLVDLPGYGFAYASEERASEWKKLMHHYILGRGKSLKRVLFLLDARHGFKKTDFDFLQSLQQALPRRTNLPPIQLILTKCDLVSQKDLAKRVVQVKEQLSDILVRQPSSLPVMLVSARAGLGFNNIRGNRARGGILELQKDLASLVPKPRFS